MQLQENPECLGTQKCFGVVESEELCGGDLKAKAGKKKSKGHWMLC